MKIKDYSPPVYIGQNLYIKPSYIVSIPEFYTENKGMSILQLLNQTNLENNDKLGKLSRKAVQGVRNSINWLCLAALPKRVFVKSTGKTFSFKVNFITLTLPDTMAPINSVDLQKKLLNPFLVYMRKMQGLKNYVWRLEFQANGKLHAHLTTDSFLHLKVIRETWNRLLKKHGYMDEFFKKHGHTNPNSTDVHATKSIKNLAGYIAKYMSKKNSSYKIKRRSRAGALRAPLSKAWYKQRLNFWNSPFNPRPIKGRIWSCNYELSAAGKCKVHVPANEAHAELRTLMQPCIEYKSLYTVPQKDEFYELRPDHPMYAPRKIGELYFIQAKDWITTIRGVVKKTFEDTRKMVTSLARQYEVYELN
jgi:hypothetical protein